MKKHLLILFALLTLPLSSSYAYNYTEDGILYNLYSDDKATVTHNGSGYNSYSGACIIPATISHNYYTVTSIGNDAFSLCPNLTSISIPNTVTSIGESAFFHCTGLTSITIPNSVISIGKWGFAGCTGLTSIIIPRSVKIIGDIGFTGCSGLETIIVESGNTEYDSRGNCNAIIETATNTLIQGCKKTIIPGSVENIGNSAFSGCTDLKNIVIPNSVKFIGSKAFWGCSNLMSVKIPNSVISIAEFAFYECTALTTVYSYIMNPNSISAGCFSCYDNTTLYVPKGTKEKYQNTSGWNQFQNIVEMDYPVTVCINDIYYDLYENEAHVTFADDSHKSYSGDITIPSSVTHEGITYPVISIDDIAFSGCTDLTNITIPNSVTSIDEGSFSGCTGLETIKVESGNAIYDSKDDCNAIIETATNTLILGCKNTVIPSSVTTIGDGAFQGCTDLTKITIPNSVTTIGNSAFQGCTELTSITIPSSVKNIEGYAFYDCTGLKEVHCYITEPMNILPYTFEDKNNLTIYVPKGTKEKYDNAEGWGEFYNIEEMDNPSAIENVEANKKQKRITKVYTIDGKQIVAPQSGLYIIKDSDGKTIEMVK